MAVKKAEPRENVLYYGDNLDVMRRYIRDNSVDLVYLDPPFNSHRDYNVLFLEHDGARAAAQVKAFKDTWEWDAAAARTYVELVEGGGKLSEAMQAFRLVLGETDMLAYLSMMAPRLAERVLAGSVRRRAIPAAGSLSLGGGEGDGVRLPGGTKV
jgi:hypothetical protein